MRNLIKTAAAIVFALLGANFAQAQDKTVHMGTMIWEDLKPISLITKKFLEKQGYNVKLTEFSEWGIAFGALSKGDIDIMVAHVNYVTADYWAKNHSRLEKISVVSHGLRQGIVVPSYMSVDSIDQLNEVRDEVGGQIIGIEPGSGLMREVAQALEEYDLDYKVVDGSTAAMIAQLQSSIERRDAIVTMLWEPSWMVHKFDVKFLNDPKSVFAPPQTYYWIGGKGFSAENPDQREAVASVYVPIEDITQINADMNEGASLEQAVEAWWENNAELIEKWSVM